MASRRTILLSTDDCPAQLAFAPTSLPSLLTYIESLFSIPATHIQLFDSLKALIPDDKSLQLYLEKSLTTPAIYVAKADVEAQRRTEPADYIVGFSDRSQLRLQQLEDNSVTHITSPVLNWMGRACLYLPEWVLFTGGQVKPKGACLISISDGGATVTEMGELKQGRVWHGLCVVGSTAFAIGGKDPDTGAALKTAEMLNAGNWTLIPPMSTPRESMAIVAHKDSVYVVGGYDGTKRLQSIEVMQNRRWSTLDVQLPEGRQMSGLVFLSDTQMMVAGGQDDLKAKKNVYLVDLEARRVENLLPLPVADYFTGRQLVRKASGEVWGFGKQTYIYFPTLRMWATAPSLTRRASLPQHS